MQIQSVAESGGGPIVGLTSNDGSSDFDAGPTLNTTACDLQLEIQLQLEYKYN